MMRSFLLYPLLALAAFGLIRLSFDIGPDRIAPTPQSGAALEGGVSFGPSALGAVAPGENQDVFLARDREGRPAGLRLAIRDGAGEPGEAEAGSRLLIGPDPGARWAGKALTVAASTRPLLYPTAPELAVRLHTDQGPGPWVKQATATPDGVVRFEMPPAAGPVTAIGLRPVNPGDGDSIAVEIAELVVAGG